MKPFLKWAGGKYRVLPKIEEILPYAIHTKVPNYLSIVLNKQTTLEEMNMKSGVGKTLDNIKFKFFQKRYEILCN